MVYIFSTILLVSFAVLFSRLIELDIIRGKYYAGLSSENRVRRIPIPAPRGLILDRDGRVLADNLEEKRVAIFEAGNSVEISVPVRTYPGGEAFAHILGYLGEATEEEVKKVGCPRGIYSLGQKIGRIGAEQTFDCVLGGKDGEELVEVDTKGKKVRILGQMRAQKGEDIKLSIDKELQERAFSALARAGLPGAVVATRPRTGEILVLVSHPSFDPNTLSTNYPLFITDKNKPLFNRAISGVYPPGSTFKIVTAAAGLEEGKIDSEFRYVDTGVISVGSFEYRNWYFTQYGRTEGKLDIVRAIKRSTDTFFYKMGEMVGVEKLASWAQKFGLGEVTKIDIPGEVGGIVPTPKWKERVRGEKWFLGNTYHMSIGQADLTATPLQVAQMTSVIASGGKLCTPIIENLKFKISKFDSRGLEIENCRDIGLSDKTIDLIHRGMTEACSPGGTAFPLFNFKVKDQHLPEGSPSREIQVACKTGTAEFGDPQDRTHAWLTAFAPSEDPEIVVTVLVEGGGEGSRVAAPIAKQIFEEWFGR